MASSSELDTPDSDSSDADSAKSPTEYIQEDQADRTIDDGLTAQSVADKSVAESADSGEAPGYPGSTDEGQRSLEVTVYSPDNPLRHPLLLLRQMQTDIWKSRDLIWRMFNRNLRGMYRQTLLGLFWIFLPPLASTAVWIFLKSQAGFQFEIGVDYLAYVMTGMVLWQGFIEAFQSPAKTFQSNRSMFAKVNVPREAMILVGILETAFNMSIRCLLLLPVFLLTDILWSPWQLLGLTAIPVLLLFGAALGLLLLPFGALYHDIGRFLIIVLPFWMICTPVVYPTPQSFPANLVVYANPVSPLLVSIRDLLVGLPATPLVAEIGLVMAFMSIPLFLIALVVFRITVPTIIERV